MRNFLKDFGASIRNIVGGRSAGYEEEIIAAKNDAIREMETRAAQMGANAVVGVKVDYESFGNAGMVMVIATGTAVVAAMISSSYPAERPPTIFLIDAPKSFKKLMPATTSPVTVKNK